MVNDPEYAAVCAAPEADTPRLVLAECKALKKCRRIVVSYSEEFIPEDGLELLRKAFRRQLDP